MSVNTLQEALRNLAILNSKVISLQSSIRREYNTNNFLKYSETLGEDKHSSHTQNNLAPSYSISVEDFADDDDINLSNGQLQLQLQPQAASSPARKAKIFQDILLKELSLYKQWEMDMFLCRSKTFSYPFNQSDTCLTSISSEDREQFEAAKVKKEAKLGRKIEPIGPFLVCPASHTEGLPYHGVFPCANSRAGERTTQPHPYARPCTAPGPTARPTSAGPDRNRCRACPSTYSVFMDSDDYYEEYKRTITFGKIDKSHQKKIIDRYQTFMATEGSNEQAKNASSTKIVEVSVTNKEEWDLIEKMQRLKREAEANGAMSLSSGRNLNGVPQKVPGRGNGKIMYGPAAIAHVTGYKFGNTGSNTKSLQRIHSHGLSRAKGGQGPIFIMQNQQPLTIADIPWAPDNVRYYDDDTDPCIVDILGTTPFTPPTSHSSIIAPFSLLNIGKQTDQAVTDTSPLTKVTVGPGPLSPRKGQIVANVHVSWESPRDTSRPNALIGKLAAAAAVIDKPKESQEKKETSINTTWKPLNTTDKRSKPKQNQQSSRPIQSSSKSQAKQTGKKGAKAKAKKKATRRYKQSIATVALPTPSSKPKPVW